jgi:rRNA maturation RNase YbeY
MNEHFRPSVLRILNRQKMLGLDRRLLSRISRALLEELLGRKNYELGVHLIGAEEMATINETFLGHEGLTDVITFDYSDDKERVISTINPPPPDVQGEGMIPAIFNGRHDTLHGELFICVDEALIQGRRFRVSWQEEIVRYLVHALLHLQGFDDKKAGPRRKMKRVENKLVKELSRRFDLSKLGLRRQSRRFP